MSGRPEPSMYLQDSDPEISGSNTMSVALIGPDEVHRRVVAKALANSEAHAVREFAAYPSTLNDLPRLLQENFNVIMIDLDSDQEVALRLVEKIASVGDATVMVYSAQDDPDLLARCMRAGARDFLPLPQEEVAHARSSAQVTPAPPAHVEAPRPVPVPPPAEIHRTTQTPTRVAAPPAQKVEERSRLSEIHIAPTPPPRPPAPPVQQIDEAPRVLESPQVPELPARAAVLPDHRPEATPHFSDLHIAPEPVEHPSAPLPSDLFLAPEPTPQLPAEPAQKAEHPHTLDDLYTPPGRPARTTVPLPADRFIASEQPEVTPEPPAPVVHDAPVPSPAPAAFQAHYVEETQPVESSEPLPAPIPAPKDDFSEWDDIHLRGAQPAKAVKPSLKYAGKTKSAKKEAAYAADEIAEPAPKPTRAEIAEQRAMFREIAAEDGIRTPRDKMMWILIGAVPIALAVILSLVFMHPAHHSAPASAPVQNVAPPVSTNAVPDSAPGAAPPTAATPQPAPAKPSPTAPAAQVGAPSAPNRGKTVSPDAMDAQLNAPSRISPEMKRPVPSEEAPSGFTPVSMEGSGAAPILGSAKHVNVVPVSSRVSAGVAQGLLIRKIEPVYPQIAKTSRESGTVVMSAVITKSGAIGDLHVVSGPPMLRQAALDAVKQWRYRPYMLNNQPVEVETTVSVVFNLGN